MVLYNFLYHSLFPLLNYLYLSVIFPTSLRCFYAVAQRLFPSKRSVYVFPARAYDNGEDEF
jgi:hypothetical protein